MIVRLQLDCTRVQHLSIWFKNIAASFNPDLFSFTHLVKGGQTNDDMQTDLLQISCHVLFCNNHYTGTVSEIAVLYIVVLWS